LKPNFKKILIYLFLFIVLLIIIIPKIFFQDTKTSQAPGRSFAPVPVEVKIARFEKLDNNFMANGTILANEQVELRSEISGRIVSINFKEGTRVKEGELLVKINDSELQAQLMKAESRKKIIEENEFRQKSLLEKSLTSKQEYDAALNELNMVLADIELLKAQIEKTEITAPFSGIVGLRNVSIGSYITPSIIIASLQMDDPIKIDFAIPQKYFNSIKTGSKIEFRIPSSGQKLEAKVYAIEPKIDLTTRTLQVRALTSNPKRELMPGTYVEVEIILNEISNAIIIPTQSIIPDLSGERVFLVKNGIATPKIVKSGIRTETSVQIIEGISEGDSVISSGIIQLRPGSRVKITNIL